MNGAQRFAKAKGRPPGKTEDEGELEDDYDYLLERDQGDQGTGQISRIETPNSERRPGIKLMSRYLSVMRTHSGPENRVDILAASSYRRVGDRLATGTVRSSEFRSAMRFDLSLSFRAIQFLQCSPPIRSGLAHSGGASFRLSPCFRRSRCGGAAVFLRRSIFRKILQPLEIRVANDDYYRDERLAALICVPNCIRRNSVRNGLLWRLRVERRYDGSSRQLESQRSFDR